MLILARKVGEAVAINDDIIIRVLEVKGGQAKLGIEAPKHVAVHREEVYLRIVEENKKAAQDAPADLTSLATAFGKGGLASPGGMQGLPQEDA